jgi:hypothetical protein
VILRKLKKWKAILAHAFAMPVGCRVIGILR